MKIALQRAMSHTGRSSRQTLLSVEKDHIIIGRGGASDLIISDPSVGTEHARIFESGDGLRIEDLGTVGTTLVDGAPVKAAALYPKSKIQLGSVQLFLTKEDDCWYLVIEEDATKAIQTKQFNPALEAAKLDIRTLAPTTRSMIFIALIVTLCSTLLYPLLSNDQSTWSSGPIANVHQNKAADCQSCHLDGFSKVADSSCRTCHSMTKHAENTTEARCVSCHLEHKGDKGLKLRDNALCGRCHQDIKHQNSESKLQDVPRFDSHPEFMITQGLNRVPLHGQNKARDITALKLNHKVHLAKNIIGPRGPETLSCQSCHTPAASNRTMEPISMERHCARCHPLGYDDRLPEEQVPHGDPDSVYRFLFAGYTKLLLRDDPQVALPKSTRSLPGKTPLATSEGHEAVDNRTDIEDAARAAEKMLFSRTACHLCHVISEREGDIETLTAKGLSQYIVQKPELPTIWLPKAQFAHGSHLTQQCQDCHADVLNSSKTEDLLLPAVATCQKCHSDVRGHGKVESNCTMCHSFHDQEWHRKAPVSP